MDTVTDWLEISMWFEQPQGLQFKITVRGKLTPIELVDLARMNWDCNVKSGCLPKSNRP